jgi:hypothetical protein
MGNPGPYPTTLYVALCNQHLHKDLLRLTNQLLKDRDHKQLKTHIGKVKSHTYVEYNKTADKAERERGWTDKAHWTSHSKKRTHQSGAYAHGRRLDTTLLTNQKTSENSQTSKHAWKRTKTHQQNSNYQGRLRETLTRRKRHRNKLSIHAYSQSPYRSRRDAYEVAWGSHVYKCKKKHNSQGPMLCTKCNQPLTNTHLLGGCKYNS